MPAIAHAAPSRSASPAWASSSFLRPRACAPIQTIMLVTKTTATAEMTASMPSCARCGRLVETTSSVTPTAIESSTAATTPTHMGRIDAPLRLRNAARMPTTSAASRPSRRPMTNVASTGTPGAGGR